MVKEARQKEGATEGRRDSVDTGKSDTGGRPAAPSRSASNGYSTAVVQQMSMDWDHMR